MAIFYVDGDFVDDSSAAIPLTDMAVLRGYAVFDFLRTYGEKPFYLDTHLQRLKNSAELLHIDFPWSLQEISDLVYETLKRNSCGEANIRLLVTGGDSLDSITPLGKPRLIIMVTPVSLHPDSWYKKGASVITADVTRYVPGAKSTNYIKAIMALRRARQSGAIESIYVNEEDQLLEGTTSNLFMVIDGKLITPQEDILAGVTRQVVIKLVKEKFDCRQGIITRHDIAGCSEVFITSSTKEIVPVIQIDKVSISKEPGPITQQVMADFQQYTRSL